MMNKHMPIQQDLSSPIELAEGMPRLGDLARHRLVAWMDASPTINQTALAAAVGVGQSWISRYRSGEQDADIDQLHTMARAFGHTLAELLDLRTDQQERELLEAYRKLPEGTRALAVQVLRAMTPPAPPRKSARTRE